MMTSTQIRQSFLDFFRSKQHTIVPSSSLMPDSPNLLFTNAGMNQFVPIFLNQTPCPYSPGRAADTQKCIRAGGKHNDLDDVGLDTYHHTFFEMLGNWSFGDYFKRDAIDWAWELVIGHWRFPANRLYTTVFCPHMDMERWKDELAGAVQAAQNRLAGHNVEIGAEVIGGPKGSAAMNWSDDEAASFWAEHFIKAGLDPLVHIVPGSKKDNFWMMGETGPCGPCSELHVDLTPLGDTQGSLVNKGDARCIEIWNNVFIQFNANPDGTFSPLPAKHVDTGMGFERVTSIIQGTKNFTDFAHAKISNYETDIFRPIFDELEKMSGKKYGSTLPTDSSQLSTLNSQLAVDIAFRVIGDHIRTLSFAIADGIQPGNTDRNYVLRRILRRAVRYGRTLGFHEPFFYKLVDVLAATMGDVFPEIRTRKQHVKDVLKLEEESFNKTLDKGIALFNEEVGRLQGTLPVPGGTGHRPVAAGNLPAALGATYAKRNLPHFEKPWAIYAVNFQTHGGRTLSPAARDIVLDCILHWRESRYRLVAACVMPDHVHLIFQPGIKEEDKEGNPVFWPLSEIFHSIKSFSAKEVNKLDTTSGILWQDERFDRYIRSDRDLGEKFRYVCGNPWTAGIVDQQTPYRWLWTQDIEAAQPYVAPESLPYAPAAGQVARQNGPVARSTQAEAVASKAEAAVTTIASAGTGGAGTVPGGTGYQPVAAGNLPAASVSHGVISCAFAFRLYDEQGFPLDLTELMARERGLSVDVAGFNALMEEQKARARAAQKKTVIELSQIETKTPTRFLGYDALETPARVLEVVGLKDKTAVVLDTSTCYAEMGGQLGDTGELTGSGQLWRVVNTQKSGNTWLHFVEGGDAPAVGASVTLTVEKSRRDAIQRHHTVTHLLHWALHEVVNKEASQKGSFVGPDKLTFDFNSAALTPAQVADIERLVNERIVENAGVSWTEVPHADVKGRKDVMQFFGDKYGDTVRVVQIGGRAQHLDGYSMELCGGTHTRATGEIGLFRIVGENAIAAGVRRIEAVAGLEAYALANDQLRLIRTVAGKLSSPIHELEKKIETLLAHQRDLEKALKAAHQKEAAGNAKSLLATAEIINGTPAILANISGADGDTLQTIADALKSHGFKGVVVLGGAANGAVALVASVSSDFTVKAQAGKIIQAIAPIVGGKGGGKPDNARGGGKDATKLDEALEKVKGLLG